MTFQLVQNFELLPGPTSWVSFIILCQAYPDPSTSKSEDVDFSPFAIGVPTRGKLASLGIEPGSPDPQSNPLPNIQTELMTHQLV